MMKLPKARLTDRGELLRDALRRAVAASSMIGIRAVVVDAIDDSAAAFYEHFAFRAIPGRPHTLMVPVPAIIAASSA